MKNFNFSGRTSWQRNKNVLTQLVENRLRDGREILDLTESNPTKCGFLYPESRILDALSRGGSLQYSPDPRGLLSARKTVAAYYEARHISVSPSEIFLTSSSSEGYSMIFRILCEFGDSILIPRPSYPLFEFLAQLNDVNVVPYDLQYDGEWHVDVDSILERIQPTTRAIVIVNPHNPTGMFLKRNEYKKLQGIAQDHGLAIIIDEVFADYGYAADHRRLVDPFDNSSELTFLLNGLSKLAALPQMKLGWVVVKGGGDAAAEVRERLEIIADTYLSVNTPVQLALPEMIGCSTLVREQILQRCKSNIGCLDEFVEAGVPCTRLVCEGGWNAVLRVPSTKTDEQWAIELLEQKGVSVFPGYYFDFQETHYIVVSLLLCEKEFRSGIKLITDHIRSV